MDPSSVAPWAEHGILGLVIGALFVALFAIVKWLIGHIDNQSEKHREERREWREAAERITKDVEASSNVLSDGIKELINKLGA